MQIKNILHSLVAVSLLLAWSPVQAEITITYPTGWEDLIEPAIKAYEKETGEKVSATQVPKELDQRINVDFAGGAATDVVIYDSYRTAEYTESDYLANLNGFTSGWDDWKHYYDSIKAMATVDGHVRGIPVYTDVRMLWYNNEIFKKVGIATPWKPETWEDVLKAAASIKKAAPEVEYPLYFPVGTKLGEATTMQGFYMALLGADKATEGRNRLRDWQAGKWVGDSPALRRTFGLYKTIFVDQKLSSRELYYSPDVWGDMRRAFIKNNIGIMANGSWEFSSIWRSAGLDIPSVEERFKFLSWTPFPGIGKDGAPIYSNISGGWNIGLNQKSANKEKAWGLVEKILKSEPYTNWVVAQGRVTVRKDAAAAAVYQADPYLSVISPLVINTTGRDTYPGYSAVSAFVQQATASILDGVSIEEVVAEYKENLIDEFGEEAVKTIK